MTVAAGDALTIVHLYPTVLGLYGDRGNALVLAHRARARGLAAQVLSIDPGQPIPRHADCYLLGGGEDLAQVRAVELLREDGGLAAVVARDAPVLAVCAGFQVLGRSFPAGGGTVDGLDLVDLVTEPGSPRSVGEVLATATGLDLPTLTGYENHGGWTTLGPGLAPLARIVRGIGNRPDAGVDGCRQGRLIGTYLHGPCLARNPALADVLLQWAAGMDVMPPIDDSLVDQLRAERLNAALR